MHARASKDQNDFKTPKENGPTYVQYDGGDQTVFPPKCYYLDSWKLTKAEFQSSGTVARGNIDNAIKK